MNTRWNMAFFLFFGLIGAIMLICTVISNVREEKRPIPALIASACALTAFMIICLGLNNPLKILTVLSTPQKGFSGAIIMQVVMIAAGMLIFIKSKAGNKAIPIAAFVISILSVYALSKQYMITVRPALNTYILTIIFLALVFQTAWYMYPVTKKRAVYTALGLNIFYGVFLLIFTLRMKIIAPPDHVLDFMNVTFGALAPVYWGAVLCTFIMPLACTIMALRGKTIPKSLNVVSIAGLFSLCLLINQMPIIARGINNRIFMDY